MPKAPSPAEKLAKLEAQVKAAKAELKAQEQKRLVIVGAAVVAEMQRAPEFRSLVADVLRRVVKRPADKADIAGLLL